MTLVYLAVCAIVRLLARRRQAAMFDAAVTAKFTAPPELLERARRL